MRIALCSMLLIGAVAAANLKSDEPSKPQTEQQQIVLIDMARTFKESREFKDRRDDLKAEIKQRDELAKRMAAKISEAQKKLKQLTEGTAEHVEAEKELTAMSRQFEDFRKDAQRDFMTKESRIYKDIYLKVQETVRRIAEERNCALVIRFNSEPLNGKDPKKLIQGLQRQIIYHREKDDITDQTIKALNNDYNARVELDR